MLITLKGLRFKRKRVFFHGHKKRLIGSAVFFSFSFFFLALCDRYDAQMRP